MPQILDGLRKNEFTFFLQPRYDLNTRRVVGAEALVRWNHPVLGVISPAVFIPVLENNGYITKLDQYIWEEVCKTIRVWIDAGVRPVPIAVNVTKTDILAIDVAEFFSEMLKKYRIPPKYLNIDIAKSAYLETHGALSDMEAQLQQMGFRVILDGFDGDYVELSALGGFGTDLLKLDLRSAALQNKTDVLPGIFAQARTLRLNLLAEGIESTEQLNVLRKAGCTEGQGYLFSRPLSVDEFVRILKVGHSG
ncbi:EAL domain-containing protein [Faecalibacterium sp. 7]|uniref:EAL domain-containing protein n=1 Tax=Faecalibacterium sp. 7 TaxID=3402017 RepID=UPI003C2DB745